MCRDYELTYVHDFILQYEAVVCKALLTDQRILAGWAFLVISTQQSICQLVYKTFGLVRR